MPVTGFEFEEDENISYRLTNNYPNPFNPSTTINYSIPDKSNVILDYPRLYGKKFRCGQCGVQWRER